MKELLAVLTVLGFIFGAVLATTVWYRGLECGWNGEAVNKETKFSWQTGCLVKVKDNWVPYRQWRVID